MSDRITIAYRSGLAAGKAEAAREIVERLDACYRSIASADAPRLVWRSAFDAAKAVVGAYANENERGQRRGAAS